MEDLKDMFHLFTDLSTIRFEDIKKEYRYMCIYTFDNKQKLSFARYLPWGSSGTYYWDIYECHYYIGSPPIVSHIMVYESLVKKDDVIDQFDCSLYKCSQENIVDSFKKI